MDRAIVSCKFAACICIYRYFYTVHITDIRQVTLKVKSKQNFKVYARVGSVQVVLQIGS
jgi:hypothetical protein